MVLGRTSSVLALAGGVGGAKLVDGLAQVVPPEQLTVIGNVADDFVLYGLHISPDLDTILYTLAGLANPLTGWGIEGDTWHTHEMLARYGDAAWFRLGDRDLGTHLLRTQWLAEGDSLTQVTARLCAGLGVPVRLLPATDDPIMTMLDTVEGSTLEFQDYFVRRQWQPAVQRVWVRGCDRAHAGYAVLSALREADIIIICPSNPVLSIDPILRVPGVREALRARGGVCVAVSPFVGGAAVKGPAAKLMGELGLDITPPGLAQYYGELVDGLIVDVADREAAAAAGVPVLVTPTLMRSRDERRALADVVLEWVGSVLS